MSAAANRNGMIVERHSLTPLEQALVASQRGRVAHCHVQIREIAQEMSRHAYELLMHYNEFYTEWKALHPGRNAKQLEELFVRRNWGKYVEEARATLAKMLNTSIDDARKDAILEVLILDNQLVRGRKNPQRVIGTKP